MKVEVTMTCGNMSPELLQTFIQALREWELRSPADPLVTILVKSDPPLESEVLKRLLAGVRPAFKNIVDIKDETLLLRLGRRLVVGEDQGREQVFGMVEDVSLSLVTATARDIQRLQDAVVIKLVKVSQG